MLNIVVSSYVEAYSALICFANFELKMYFEPLLFIDIVLSVNVAYNKITTINVLSQFSPPLYPNAIICFSIVN